MREMRKHHQAKNKTAKGREMPGQGEIRAIRAGIFGQRIATPCWLCVGTAELSGRGKMFHQKTT
jgi:hypothetical protein